MSNNVWIVLSGEEYEDGVFHGHFVRRVYHEDKSFDEIVEEQVPEHFEKHLESWEVDDFVWIDIQSADCIIIEKHNVDT